MWWVGSLGGSGWALLDCRASGMLNTNPNPAPEPWGNIRSTKQQMDPCCDMAWEEKSNLEDAMSPLTWHRKFPPKISPKIRNKRQSLNKTWPNIESLLLHLLMIHYWLDDCFKVLNEFKLNLLTVTWSFSKFTSYIFTMELNVPLCCRMTNSVAVSNFKLQNRCSVSLHWITQIVSKDYCLSSLLFCITNKNIFFFFSFFLE